jgi:hypothetical protein
MGIVVAAGAGLNSEKRAFGPASKIVERVRRAVIVIR